MEEWKSIFEEESKRLVVTTNNGRLPLFNHASNALALAYTPTYISFSNQSCSVIWDGSFK